MSAAGRVYSVNVSGDLREVEYGGQVVTTGYFKHPVEGEVVARRLGLEGDAQADLKVHGGPAKAVYFYPREHYEGWERLLETDPLPPGSFGENITAEGLTEADLAIGDVIRIGTALLQVRQPRSPCYKMQIRFGRPDMVALFIKHGLPGWYASVIEGSFTTGDAIEIVSRASEGVSVADIWRYSLHAPVSPEIRQRISGMDLLPSFWRERIVRG